MRSTAFPAVAPPPTPEGTATLSAVVVATTPSPDGSPAALLRFEQGTVLGRLVSQLRAAGVSQVRVLAPVGWVGAVRAAVPDVDAEEVEGLGEVFAQVARAAREASGGVVLAAGEIVVHDAVVGGLLTDPRVASGAVTGPPDLDGHSYPGVRTERATVVSAGSAWHRISGPTETFLGLLKVGRGDVEALDAVARELAAACADGMPPRWEPELAAKRRAWEAEARRAHADAVAPADVEAARVRAERQAEVARHDAVAVVLTGLARRHVLVTAAGLAALFWARPLSRLEADAAGERLALTDERRALVESAVKPGDGFFTTHFVDPYSKHVAAWAARHGITPNQVTAASAALGIAAAAAFAQGRRAGLVTGAVLLQLAFTADCLDGQLARLTRRFSPLGGWLDAVSDRVKEYLAYAGLAVGAVRTGDDATIWLLAGAALALQLFHHSVLYSYDLLRDPVPAGPRVALTEPDERDAQAGAAADGTGRGAMLRRLGRGGMRAAAGADRRRWGYWVKRAVVLPIGERFALISLTAALAGPRTTFGWLLGWGTVAAAYSTAGRVLRSSL